MGAVGPAFDAMRRIHISSRSHIIVVLRRWLPALVLLGTYGALAPAAGATATPSTAAVTNATTGQTDASSVVPVGVCGAPTAVRAACLANVLVVRGTQARVHPRLQRPASPNRLGGRRPARSPTATPLAVTAAAAPQPGTPAYLQQAYDLSYLSQTAGAGATIAIVDAYDAPHAEADLAAYRSEFGLPACTTANGCFKKVGQTGGTNYPTQVSSDWETETSLDLDAVSALCPYCHIVLVEANSSNLSDLAQAQAEAGQVGASVISDSWAVQLTGTNSAQVFASSGSYTFPGITTVAASGDYGYLGSRTNYFPAALGDVTAAGGTTLVPASTSGVQSARGFDEYAWSGAGSGCVSREAKPAWQTDTGCGGRAYADLSADADPATGMQVYDSDQGGWLVVGGTSEAAALIASYYALVGAATGGPSWAYANAALMNDPTVGSNGSCTIFYFCNAQTGYDGPTGVGSISGAVVAGAPGIGGPGPNGSYTESVSDTSAQLRGGVYPNGTDTTYWWEYGTDTSYGHKTTSTDIGAGAAPASVANALAGLRPGTTYHYRLVAQNNFGPEYGYDFTLTTSGGTNNSSQQGSGGSTTPTPPLTPPATTPPATGTTPPSAGTSSSPPTAPAVAMLRVASAGANTANITAAVSTGGSAASYSMQYGNTSALGRRLTGSLAAFSTGLNVTLRNLAPGRTYYVRAVITNAGGSATSATIRFRTSPVTITRVTIRGGKLQAVLRCYGKAPCRVKLQARSGSRLLAAGQATIPGNRDKTVSLPLSSGRQPGLRLTVLSSGNGYPTAVTASAYRR
jgi:hypothetical protein